MIALLAHPDLAVLAVLAGLLMVYFECNRPGSIVPGCLGVLFILLGIHSLRYLPLRPVALILTATGMLLPVLAAAVPRRNLLVLAGISSLACGLASLVQPFAPEHVHLTVAIFTSVAFGLTTSSLAFVALRARINKRLIERPATHPAAAQDRLKPSSCTR